MASWASITAKPVPEAAPPVDPGLLGKRVAVVDANAIIAMGTAVSSLGDVLMTTDEVLAEVRDPVARQAMEQATFMCRKPSDFALKMVAAFARKTGDLHQLSSEDLRLLAVAYALETELNGIAHLRSEPVPVTVHAKQTPKGALPGWGNNGQSDEWAAIDALDDDDGSTVQCVHSRTHSMPSTAAHPALTVSSQPSDDEDWEVARKSRNAGRRAKRKAMKWVDHETAGRRAAACGQSVTDAADAVAQLRITTADELVPNEDALTGSERTMHAAVQEAPQQLGDASMSQGLHEIVEETAIGACSANGSDAELGHERGSQCADRDASADVQHVERQADVFLVTADFAMQNVALQIGLRLESKGGRRITSLQRFVMRCDGCHTVCKSTAKLFCPACGHATLSRVSVTVGPDGAEQYGVRKKHVLRGTRYSLPKPKSGRNAANPILSEDVYKLKVRKPRKKAVDISEDPLEGGLTLGELKKHANQPAHIAQGLSHLSTSWRNNPNERRDTVKNSRRR